MNEYEKSASCITELTAREPYLTGAGVIVAVIDSGIDFFLSEFMDENGRTRILAIWDQSGTADAAAGTAPPTGYNEGVLYTREMIDEAILLGREKGQAAVPVFDYTGHGTAVAAVAAGRACGVAAGADILAVKLGEADAEGFPRTTQLMRGIDFCVKTGARLKRPVAVNISFGNTYGDHRGNSLLERFIDNACEIGKSAIIIGSGNEGASNGHTSGAALAQRTAELSVADYETGLSIQLWKYAQDVMNVEIVSPSGEHAALGGVGAERYTLGGTELLCYAGEPLPYSVAQEIFIDMIPTGSYIDSGVWRLVLSPVSVVTGEYRLYLPSYAARNAGTGFFLPSPEMTFTIPSTAERAIAAGAYSTALGGYADFSGRGYVYRYEDSMVVGVKPDIAAPGVDITVPLVGGGYEKVSGTSFAAPFVTGTAALIMEWGIVRGNDSYMYGERLKALLIKNARAFAGEGERPDSKTGWGKLCAIPL